MPSDRMRPPEFLIYRSSAGSGKTQALAKEYLKLVLSQRANFRNILAITFTNKAAEEMKERVLHLLHLFGQTELPEGYQQNLFNDMVTDCDTTPAEMRRRANYIRRDILHHYSDFHISTIDSFVHRIIRSFALELNLSFTFEVQLETDQFLQMAVDDLLADAGLDKELTNSLVQFTRSLLDEERSWNIDSELVGFSRFLTKEESIVPLEKLTASGIDFIKVSVDNAKSIQAITGEWDRLLEEGSQLEQQCRADASDFSHGERGGYHFFTRTLEKREYAKLFNRHEKAKRMVGYMAGTQNYHSPAASSEAKSILAELADLLRPVWERLTESIDRLYPELITRQLIAKNLMMLSLSRKIRNQMQVTMDRENLIPIYEFNRLIWHIIRDQPVPFVYERTSERFDHFLVDEFQDTSTMQWNNLLPLVDNALSQGGVSMVVGDAKQAIYRWRSGDVWQFIRLPELRDAESEPLVKARQEALMRYTDQRHLDHNYRSSREIIDFNNRFFSWLSACYSDELSAIYRDHEQKAGEHAGAGGVTLHMIPFDEERALTDDVSQQIADATLEAVQQYLSPEGGGYHPSDICILVRKHQQAKTLASRLIAEGYDVISGESFRLDTFKEAEVFRAVVSLLIHRGDRVAATVIGTRLFHAGHASETVLHSFLSQLKDNHHTAPNLYRYVNTLMRECGIRGALEEYICLPIYEVAEQVIRDFFGHEASSPAVQYLLDLTAVFVKTHGNDWPAFLLFLDKKMESSVPLPETGHAISIMTVHKSKGLQFPVVIYSFANEIPVGRMAQSKRLWIDHEEVERFEGLPVLLLPFSRQLEHTPFSEALEEETTALFQDMVNLVYVAFTRAMQQLHVISAKTKHKKNADRQLYDLLTRFLGETQLLTTRDEERFHYGHTTQRPEQKGDRRPALRRMPSWESYSWHDRLGIRTGNLWSVADHHRREAIDRGTMVHNLLAEVEDAESLESLIEDYTLLGLIPRGEAPAIKQHLEEILQEESVKPFFDPTLRQRREATLVMPDGQLLRPDRVVYFPDYTAVIDFKTGEPAKSHHHQVKTYCKAIEEAGDASAKGFLIYIDKKEVVAV